MDIMKEIVETGKTDYNLLLEKLILNGMVSNLYGKSKEIALNNN